MTKWMIFVIFSKTHGVRPPQLREQLKCIKVSMPEIAFETSREETAMNSEDDIMSDEEDELRLRQVKHQGQDEDRRGSAGLDPNQIGNRLRRASLKVGVDPEIAENLAQCIGAGASGARASIISAADSTTASDFGIEVPAVEPYAPMNTDFKRSKTKNDAGKDAAESSGATGAATAAAAASRPPQLTTAAAPVNTSSMFRYQKFKECPAKRPLTVCIDIPGVNVTHREVKDAVDDAIMFLKMNVFAKVHAIQFVARTVILGTPVCKNRWLVTLGDAHTMHELIIAGVNIQGDQIPVRRYDTVMSEEYKIYLQLRALEEEMGKMKEDEEDDQEAL